MKTVTPEQFKKFGPCWLTTAEGRAEFARIAAIREEWTALDVLNLPDISAEDKLWSVLRDEFIDAPILHEFACRCAEYALSFIANPDPRSVAAIEAKRKWLRGEITDAELYAARHAILTFGMNTALDAAERKAWFAVLYAAENDAEESSWNAAEDTVWAATWYDLRHKAQTDAFDVTYEYEVEMLRELLMETEGEGKK